MRICFIMYQGNMYSGGQGVYLHHLTRELVRLGHEVHVIAGRPYPEVVEGVHLHRLKTFSFWSFLDGIDEYRFRTSPLAFFHPVNFYEFMSTRFTLTSLFLMFSLRAYAKLRALSRRAPFDLVHDNQTLAYGILLMKDMGLPVVANIHHPLAIDRRNALARARALRHQVGAWLWYPWYMQRLVAARVDRIITGSQNSARSIVEMLGLPSEHVRPILDGVDVDTYRPLEGVEKEPGSLLFVGNSEDLNKGAPYLIAALGRLRGQVPFHLTLVDRKPEDLKVVPPLVRRYGLGNDVTYTGRTSTEELLRLYNRSQVLVSPSLYEGFGLPAAEAMACGTSVVATSAGAFPEVVADGVTGVLVPPADPDALASAIRSLLEDPELCRRMGDAARRRVVRRFTWWETARQTVALYDEVIARSGGRCPENLRRPGLSPASQPPCQPGGRPSEPEG
jgi:glycosyltransferase involved in cell wall biosynthesis